jgi:flavin reductase (DIM6/NTAB) family NADH-FMN oxidoreductase RutF
MRKDVSGSYVFPSPVVLLSCKGEEGAANIITLAWVGVACSDPPMITVAIRPERYSHDMVATTGEFVVNIPRSDQLELVDICGTNSGRSMDKFETCGFTAQPASVVSAPVIAECPYAAECRVVQTIHVGTHDLFVAEIVAAHADESVLDERGKVDYGKLSPLAYCPDRYFSLGPDLGRYGLTKKKG